MLSMIRCPHEQNTILNKGNRIMGIGIGGTRKVAETVTTLSWNRNRNRRHREGRNSDNSLIACSCVCMACGTFSSELSADV